MSKVLLSSFSDVGGRQIWEDRTKTAAIKTAGGLNLDVAVVADGVGGESKGERAAQLAVDSVFEYLQKAEQKETYKLLSEAASYANFKVHSESVKNDGASATLTIAAIQDATTLYIANIGDSRVYLVRGDKLTQLTMDHTFANVMVWQGKMSREAALANPRAEAIMRAVGPKANVPVDIGFYVGTTDYHTAQERGQKGLPVKDTDSILVCSDGLIKDDPNGQRFATDAEIVNLLTTQEGDAAARTLVSIALGRNADDNVTAALMQMPDPGRAAKARQPLMRYAALGALALILAIGGIAFASNQRNKGISAEATAEAVAAVTTRQAERDADAASLQKREAELAVQATEQAIMLQDERDEISARATAEVLERGDEMADENAAAKAGDAINSNCIRLIGYDGVEIVGLPNLEPLTVTSDTAVVKATWTIQNNAECSLRNIILISSKGGSERVPEIRNDNGDIANVIAPNTQSTLSISFEDMEELKGLDEAWHLIVLDPEDVPLELREQTIALVPHDTLEFVDSKEAVTNTATPQLTNNSPTTIIQTPVPVKTASPNWNATSTSVAAKTAQAQQSTLQAKQGAAAFAATQTRSAQAQQATQKAQQGAAAFSATQTRSAQAQQATQKAQQGAAAFSATQTRNAQIQLATQTAQKNAANFAATQTRNAQIQEATRSAQENAAAYSATQTRNAQIQQATQAAKNQQATQQAQQNAAAYAATQTRSAQVQQMTRQAQQQPTQPPVQQPTSAPANPYGCDYSNPTGDADNDGKQNQYEVPEALNPCNSDSDGDGFKDGIDLCPTDPAPGSGNGCKGSGGGSGEDDR